MQKIGPCLWFDNEAEEAANFYVSLFRNSRIVNTSYYAEGLPKQAGSVMTVEFILDGEEFLALNGGPEFGFTPAISFMAHCETQDEVDRLWQGLTEGGQEMDCGWLTDKFGVTWQVVPTAMGELLGGPDAAGAQRAVQAMLKMKKLDINILRRAYENG